MRTHRHAHAVRKDRGHQHADLISGLIAALTPSSQAGTSTSGPARF
jgi:hypothetical protein